MRKFTIEHVKKMRCLPDAKPAPFAGKYPTRFAFEGMTRKGVRVRYLGKPSRSAIAVISREVESAYSRAKFSYFFWAEFDREHLVRFEHNDKRHLNGISSSLSFCYHPWDKEFLFRNVPQLTLKHNGRFPFYSIFARISEDRRTTYYKKLREMGVLDA